MYDNKNGSHCTAHEKGELVMEETPDIVQEKLKNPVLLQLSIQQRESQEPQPDGPPEKGKTP